MTPAEMIEGLKQLSIDMIEIGTAMDYYGGFSHIAERGRDLVGVGLVVQEWSEEWGREGDGRGNSGIAPPVI